MEEKEFRGREKRRFLRLPAFVRVKFKRIGFVLTHRKLSKDLSIAGIRFLSDEFVPVSTYIRLTLYLREDAEPVDSICRVVWIRSLYDDEYYEIGAEICEISTKSQKQLKDYILTSAEPV